MTDEAGNELASASNSLTFIYDTVPPEPTLASSEAAHTNANPIPISVSFTEPVYGFAAADLTVTSGTAVITSGGEGDDTFTVQVTPTTDDGQVTVQLGANTVYDLATNDNVGSNVMMFEYDGVAPTATLTMSQQRYEASQPWDMTVTFSELINGFVEGDLTVTGAATITNFVATDVDQVGVELSHDPQKNRSPSVFPVTRSRKQCLQKGGWYSRY